MRREKIKDQLSWKETSQINKRMFGICAKAKPHFFAIQFGSQIVEALSPYATLYCSARFLDELTVARRTEILSMWVLVILGLTAALGLIKSLLTRMKEMENDTNSFWIDWIYGRKVLDMDFAKADDAKYSDQLVQIMQTSHFSGRGIPNFLAALPRLVGTVFQVAGGIALSVSLFTLPVEPWAQNEPLLKTGLVLAVGGILAVLMLSPVLADRQIKAWNAATESGRAGNRFFSFYRFQLYREDKRALDMRMYRQDLYGREVNKCNNSWGMGGVFMKLEQGLFGITSGILEMLSLANGISDLLSQSAEIRGNTIFLKQVLDYLDFPNEMYQGSLTVEKRSDLEYEVYSRLNDIVEDKTAIYISHRLSSCRFCDEIAVFHRGQVIERGSHEGLLAQGGKYAELWNAQSQYYV